MAGILLMILKVIGWLLLGILGLLLFLICLVLFVPVPYRVWVSGAPDADPVFRCKVKIFGIQVFPGKPNRKKKPQTDEKSAQPDKKSAQPADGAQVPQTSQRDQMAHTGEADKSNKTIDAASEMKSEAKAESDTNPETKSEKKFSKGIRDVIKRIFDELTDEGNQRAFLHVLREIRRLLHHIGPRRVLADVSYSLDDPANTGYVTAALSMCPFVYGKKCRIEPDFVTEELYVKGWADMRGHVCLIHALMAGIRLLFDRDIRRIIKRLRR